MPEFERIINLIHERVAAGAELGKTSFATEPRGYHEQHMTDHYEAAKAFGEMDDIVGFATRALQVAEMLLDERGGWQ